MALGDAAVYTVEVSIYRSGGTADEEAAVDTVVDAFKAQCPEGEPDRVEVLEDLDDDGFPVVEIATYYTVVARDGDEAADRAADLYEAQCPGMVPDGVHVIDEQASEELADELGLGDEFRAIEAE